MSSTKVLKVIKIIIAICISLAIFVSMLRKKLNFRDLKSLEFNGIVESVNYDVKGIPSINVENKVYYLSGYWGFDYKIEIGDSIFKMKDEMVIKLVKKRTGRKIIFD